MQFSKLRFVSLSLFVLCFAAVSAGADTSPVIVDSSFHTGYLPDGFDTNDSVEIVGEGLFRNSCYKPAHVEATVDSQAMRIELRAKAYFYDAICLQVLVPFHQVVSLGILNAGRYKVVDIDRKTELGDLNVRLATSSSADDFLYAPVSQAYFKTEAGKPYITIAGTYTNSCMRLVDVLVNVQPRVVTVQPIMEMRDDEACADGMFPFERKIEAVGLQRGKRYLLHVRSLNGKSINNLVDVE